MPSDRFYLFGAHALARPQEYFGARLANDCLRARSTSVVFFNSDRVLELTVGQADGLSLRGYRGREKTSEKDGDDRGESGLTLFMLMVDILRGTTGDCSCW